MARPGSPRKLLGKGKGVSERKTSPNYAGKKREKRKEH